MPKENTINDKFEKAFKAGYAAAIEDLIETLTEWFKNHPKVS